MAGRHDHWTAGRSRTDDDGSVFNSPGYDTRRLHEAIVHELPAEELNLLRQKATSLKNFAVLCMRKMFSEEERKHRNIGGQRGKPMLDPSGDRLRRIYAYLMTTYDVPQADQRALWRDCEVAIDVANRGFRKYYPSK